MVQKAKRNGGNDERHKNGNGGLVVPGRRVNKQKGSTPLDNTNPNGKPHAPVPALDVNQPFGHGQLPGGHMTQSATTSFAAIHGSSHLANNNTSSGGTMMNGGEVLVDRRPAAFETCYNSHDAPAPLSSPRLAPPNNKAAPAAAYTTASNMLSVATTILSSCPLRDVLAILIILLQLPPTVLTIVQFLFATLTFVPPQAGTPLSALSAFPSFTDIFQGSGGTPSLFTIVFADVIILCTWLLLWVPVQNFFLDLAQAVIAIALGGAAAGRNGTTNSIFICFIIILSNHLFRFRPLRQHIVHFLWTGLARGGLDFLTSPPSTPSSLKSFTTPHGWPRSLLGIHILAQGLVRMIRRSLSRREAAQSLPTGTKSDPEAGVHLEGNVDLPASSSTDGRPPGPPPPVNIIKDKVSSSRKKRKQATHVRSQQPFWAALASTKVTVLKEMESNRAANDAGEANAKDANHIGNAVWRGEEDRIWISEITPTDIKFRVSMSKGSDDDELEEQNGHAGSGIDRTKPFYLRVNGADWSSTRIRPGTPVGFLDEETGFWEGEIFGLTALSNYFCEFVRIEDDEVFYSTSLITSVGPTDEQIPAASPSAHQTLRPSSPTTTLKNSIAANDQKLQDLRNRLKRNRKDHKTAITAIRKEVETLTNRLANAGGSDERQRQRVLQFNQNVRQAEDAAADFGLQIDALGDIPKEELDEVDIKRRAWKKERDHKNAVAADLETSKSEFERQANNVESDIATALQKRERLQQRQTRLNEQYERLVTANKEGFSAKQRREQERLATLQERNNIENQYRSNINSYERRAAEYNASTSQALQTAHHYEALLQHQSQQQQSSSVPTTPEGPLPGTSSMSPHANAFTSFTFPSLNSQVNGSTPGSMRGGRGRSSSMLSNISGFTDGFEEYTSPSGPMMNNPFSNLNGYHLNGSLNGRKLSNGSGSLPSSGTSSQSSSQRDPLSPVPNKPVMVRSPTGGSSTAGGYASPVGAGR